LGNDVLLYTPELAKAFSLNHSAQAVWDLCDGQRSLVEISQELARRYDAAPEALLADVQKTVAQLRDLGLLEASPEP
jgi:coenzyme PQQ biosynthesis protein PqqD